MIRLDLNVLEVGLQVDAVRRFEVVGHVGN